MNCKEANKHDLKAEETNVSHHKTSPFIYFDNLVSNIYDSALDYPSSFSVSSEFFIN